MGEVINFAEWKKNKENEEHEKVLEEIRELRRELGDVLVDIEMSPFMYEPDAQEMIPVFQQIFATLDGYESYDHEGDSE